MVLRTDEPKVQKNNNIMCAGQDSFKNVVTFTFHNNKDLDGSFVESLRNEFGEENVISIDQSTYGIKNEKILTIDDLLNILGQAEKKGYHPQKGDVLNLLFSSNDEIKRIKYVINPSSEFVRQHPLMCDKKLK